VDTVACRQFKNRVALSLLVLFVVLAIVGQAYASEVLASEPGESGAVVAAAVDPDVSKFAVVAAAAAFAFGALGAGIAIAYVGSSAVAAVGEKPEIAGQALIFVALAEGIVVFGFITALMILGKA